MRQEPLEKTKLRHKLTAAECKRPGNLETIAARLKRGENMQNRPLHTCLSENECTQKNALCQEQLELREELQDNSSELKRYEEQLTQATFCYNRAEGYSSNGKHSSAKTFYS